MSRVKKNLKKLLIGMLSMVMMFSMAPQLPGIENVSTVSAAKVKLSKKKLTLKIGKTKKLTLKNTTGKIQWKSSNKKVAIVSKKGVITAKRAGKVTITAINKSKKYICTVTVKAGNSASGNNTIENNKPISAVVYWTPNGGVYHVTKECPTLARSKTIVSGSIADSEKERACKVCSE